MYKIRSLLLLLTWVSAYNIFAQSPKLPARVQIQYVEKDAPEQARLTNQVRTEAKTVFTAHLLADLVDLGKIYEYDVLIEGRKVSLPYPTQFQILNR